MRVRSLIDEFAAIADDQVVDGGYNGNNSDDGLGPDAVDAPFFEHKGFEIAENTSEEQADLSGFEGKEIELGKSENGDEEVAPQAENRDWNVFPVTRVFSEGCGGKYGKAGVIDGSAVPLFCYGTGWSGVGVLEMDTKRQP